MLLTKNIITIACNLARPMVEQILIGPLFIWGPGWVNLVCIAELSNQQQCIYSTIFGEKTYWDPKWGEKKDFEVVAVQKAKLALSAKQDTGAVIQNTPWLIGKDQYLFPGGVYAQGIAIGVSGAKSSADEMIAKIVLATPF
jgi:hypothetical protein